MKKTVFTGAGVAIVTPMFPDGSIDYVGLGETLNIRLQTVLTQLSFVAQQVNHLQ